MSEVHAKFTPPLSQPILTLRPASEQDENPARAFANAIALALPLWAIICAVIWAVA